MSPSKIDTEYSFRAVERKKNRLAHFLKKSEESKIEVTLTALLDATLLVDLVLSESC